MSISVYSNKILLNFYQTMWYYILEVRFKNILNTHTVKPWHNSTVCLLKFVVAYWGWW